MNENQHASTVYLASESPRRAELLTQIGVGYEKVPTSVDETPLNAEDPAVYVQRVASLKARSGWQYIQSQQLPPRPVLGADTAVILAGNILGKPRDRDHAIAMLSALAGATHRVMSAICVCYKDRELIALNTTEVSFRSIEIDEIHQYWDSGEPIGKAGAYAIQGRGAVFVEQLQGSYSSVVGLPLYETEQLLRDISAGVENE